MSIDTETVTIPAALLPSEFTINKGDRSAILWCVGDTWKAEATEVVGTGGRYKRRAIGGEFPSLAEAYAWAVERLES